LSQHELFKLLLLESYADPGASYYEARYQQRVLANLQRRAKSLGYVLQQADAAPAANGVS
jgi:hypothetical protein